MHTPTELIILSILTTLILPSCASAQKAKNETAKSSRITSDQLAQEQVTQDIVTRLTRDWPEESRNAIENTVAKYGLPNEASQSQLIWHNNGPWKRTIVYKEKVTHLFPKKHFDVLEQFVDYRVPVEKFNDLAKYDGSVIVERTKGEISARCDREEMNFLALNLADEIVKGQKTIDGARKEYGKSAMSFMIGKANHYTEKLHVKPDKNAADPDQSIMKDLMGFRQ